MWVMTKYGIIMPSVRPAETIPEGDLREIQIRARRKIDLDRLRAAHLPELGPTIYMPNTDYQFRAYCTHDELASLLASLAYEIDYVKFKPEALDEDLHQTYNALWSTLYHLWGGWGTFGRRFVPKMKTSKKAAAKKAQPGSPVGSKTWWQDAEFLAPSQVAAHLLTDEEDGGLAAWEAQLERESADERPVEVVELPPAPVTDPVTDPVGLTVEQWQIVLKALADSRVMKDRVDSTELDEVEELVGQYVESLE